MFSITREKTKKFLSAHISHTYIHTHILLNFADFFAFPILGGKNVNIPRMVSLWYDSLVLILIRPILEQSINNKMVRI